MTSFSQPLQYPQSCSSYYSLNGNGNPNFGKLADYLDVHVYSTVTITYAIR
ncbi:MAG: hypothetical protein ACREP1_07685 [Rhodanobacteraceae bacterium]